jgi:hypothetical protein
MDMTDSIEKSGTPPTQTITPPDGWGVHSAFGVLKTNTGKKLARLEEVHAWQMQRHGIPSASAAARVFGVFISDAASALGMKHGADKVRELLHITDLAEYPDSLGSISGRLFVDEVADMMPYVPHHRFGEGTPEALIYSLGVLAGEVWAGHRGDVDLNHRLAGFCSEGDFPSMAQSRGILGRLAVPFAAAHELWGWGSVAEVHIEVVARSITEAEVSDIDSLIRYRNQFAIIPVQQRPTWPSAHVEIARAAVAAHGRGGTAKFAPLLCLTPQRLSDLLRTHSPIENRHFAFGKRA